MQNHSISEKYIAPSITYLDGCLQPDEYTVKVGKSKTHAFNDRILKFSKGTDKFLVETTTIIKSGLQREKELQFRLGTQLQLSNSKRELYIRGRNFLINRISYPDFNSESPIKEIGGEVTEVSSIDYSYYSRKRYYRIILPTARAVSFRGDFTGWHYSIDSKSTYETLLKLNISNSEYHLFLFNDDKKQNHIVIDCLSKSRYDDFLLVANSALLTYAFLKGDYHGREATVFSYKNNVFKSPESIRTIILGGGIYNGFPVHSTKPFSIVQLQNKIKYKKSEDGKIIGFNDENFKKYMVEFPSENYAKLCELIISKGGILRAIILFVNNHVTTLEMKVPILFVALENATKVLVGGDKEPPKIIEDENIIKKIKINIKNAVKEINTIKREFEPEGISADDKKRYNAAFARIESKLHDFNKGTNNKKLTEPFDNFDYKLNKEEGELIIKYRNVFLHGDDFMTMEESYDIEFKELFHKSMLLHRLISILLLKASGYSGYILNNAKIHENISGKKLKEEVFIKI